MMLLISNAWAEAAPAGPAGPGATIAQFLPLIVIFLLFYFMLIRPQQKKMKEHQAMLAALQKNDEVVTNGGTLGKIVKIGDNFVTLEVADGVQIKVQRSAIQSLMPKGTIKKD
ncbi:MAG: preprotein translocase subunit YajC [Gammaproteobacteria bacterium]|nr:MAG: preprotein translocase subunit YajC [Gammaproteobacteria bacterium]RTZ61172.1 MAG: preprotein translocase subunit YajC [Gammaproteobacteria bacterium]